MKEVRRRSTRTRSPSPARSSSRTRSASRSRASTPSNTSIKAKDAKSSNTPPPEDKWAKWWRRFYTTLAMIFGFFGYLHLARTAGLILLILIVQGLIYRELVLIAINYNKERALPGFGFFYAYWFFVAVLFMYGGTLKDITLEHREVLGPTLSWIIRNYKLIGYALWVAGFVGFVLSLGDRSLYLYQFTQFGYCHMALLVVVGQSTLLAANVFSGFMWFVIPCGMVVCNDCWAYICGFFWGKTPLIKLSPKKTWEGFIGGFIATIIWSFWFTRLLQIDSLRQFYECPHKSFSWSTPDCEPSDIYALHPLSAYVGSYSFLVPDILDVQVSKMMWHAVAMSVFASFVAPFGGFFASGFKRAFRIKDFGDSIPGHGGFTDRMDCQIVMGAFAYMYYHYVVNPRSPLESVMASICRLDASDFETLKTSLENMTC